MDLHGVLSTDSTSRSFLQQDSISTTPILTAAEYIATKYLPIGIVLSSALNVHDTSLSSLSVMEYSTRMLN